MLVVELLVVLEISTDKDFQEGIRLGVTSGQLLDGIECDKIVKLEARREVNGSLDEAKSKLASLSVAGFF